jgi:hypothetical protein
MKTTTISETDKINKRIIEIQNLINSIENEIKYSILSGDELKERIAERLDLNKEHRELLTKLFEINHEGGVQ